MTPRKKAPSNTLRVAELFAGVGGFRLGLERASADGFQVVFSNQWEPSRKRQHASQVYVDRFGPEGHVTADIASVNTKDIPKVDLLVGGFPCQDYSVASTLRNSRGLIGRKGVLWWQIHRILSEMEQRPRWLMLENVDRLLASPATQRGRDLAMMLASLDQLGYAVEWRVVNAADYGMPQRRRRVFIVGHLAGTPGHARAQAEGPEAVLVRDGVLARAFPCAPRNARMPEPVELDTDLARLSRSFNRKGGVSPWQNAGSMVNGRAWTLSVVPQYEGPVKTLGDVLQPEREVPASFRIPKEELDRWKYFKGSKKEPRTSRANGHEYLYSEGAMAFPDPLDRPSRTIITGEGGKGPSRARHVVKPGRYHRRLTPVELERLNEFPDGHTEGVSDTWRAFFMGNALVVGIVERIGREVLREAAGTK